MTNFDYLKKEPKFNTFSDVAIAAERILYIDPTSCIINCRRAMEFAIKWMYSVDASLKMPYQDNLISLMSTEEFRDIIDEDLMKRMDFIRKMGNNAAHAGKKITEDRAILCLENLQIFLDFVCYCYADEYEEHTFDKSLLAKDEIEQVKKDFPDEYEMYVCAAVDTFRIRNVSTAAHSFRIGCTSQAQTDRLSGSPQSQTLYRQKQYAANAGVCCSCHRK